MYEENLEKAKESIRKAIDILEKGGEGSRGGKIIGHTKSGKPIYDKFNHPGHKDFTVEDHLDAMKKHREVDPEDVQYTTAEAGPGSDANSKHGFKHGTAARRLLREEKFRKKVEKKESRK